MEITLKSWIWSKPVRGRQEARTLNLKKAEKCNSNWLHFFKKKKPTAIYLFRKLMNEKIVDFRHG